MARDLFSNQGSTTVSSGGTTGPPSQGTTESWTVASSSTFPAASNAASPVTQFYISDPAAPSETILVTNVSGTTWSVTRGADGTTPVLHTAGFTVRNVVTAAWLTEIENRITASYNVLEYGADPTGAADSSTAFQACADAAKAYAASNGRADMTIPSGKFKLNTTFNLIGGGVTIRAYGAYIFAGSNNDLFRDWTAQDTTYTLNGMGLQILGGIWDCKGQNWGISSNASLNAGGFSAFTLSNSSNILLQDLTIRNIYDYHAIDINTCDGVVVDNCRFEGFQNNFTWHTNVRLASTANVAALTGNVSIDSVTTAPGDRVLLKNQTTTTQNGIYVTAAGAWARAADMDAAGEADRAAVAITAGTVNTGTAYYQSAVNPTPGSAAMTWVITTGFNTQSRYFSEAVQIDEGPNNTPSKNITVTNSYMGPAIDGSGLLSFGKHTGSHTDSPSVVYQNIHVIGNTSVGSLSNSFQGDSWADAVISGNIVLGSSERGVRCLFNSSNTGPRITITGNTISNTTLHGIEIDGVLGTFADVNISGNTLTNTAMASGNKTIRVDTCSRLTISGNEIQNNGTGDQGIYVTAITGGSITGNSVYNAGLQGIQVANSSFVLVSGNTIVTPQDGGIYLSAGAVKCCVSDNLIVGANNSTTSVNGSVVISNNVLNVNNVVMGNRVHKGAGSNSTTPFRVEGSNVTVQNEFNGNSVGSEWGYGYSNFSINGATNQVLSGIDGQQVTRLGSDVTGLTSTTLANVTGLSAALPVTGKYRFKVFGAHQNASLVGIGFGITGPTTVLSSYTFTVQTGVSGGATNVVHSNNVSQNTSKSGNVAIVNTTYGFSIDGWIEVSAVGTLQIQYLLSAAGTAKILTGTTLVVERVT